MSKSQESAPIPAATGNGNNEALEAAIHGVNLAKGIEMVGEFVQTKRAFWRFPLEVVTSREDYENFMAEMQVHHELIEAFSMSNSPYFFKNNPARSLSTLLYCDILKVLELRSCSFGGTKVVSHLARFIRMTPSCSCIDLSSNGFTGNDTAVICNALQNNSVVIEFLYENNGVNDNLCIEFREVVRSNNMLEALNLSANPFGEEGERHFLAGLHGNDSLKKLEYNHLHTKNPELAAKLKTNQLNWRQKFIRDLKKEETGKWNRSKLMFIGQGRAGKTSTVNRLLNKGFDAKQDSTVGASVSQTQTSTTQEQLWKTVQESDPEYLGAGMVGNQAGQLFAARNMVGKVDETKKKALEAQRMKGIRAGKKNRLKLANEKMAQLQAAGDGEALELSEEAKRLLEEQQERDEAANKLFLEQERLRQMLELKNEREEESGQGMSDAAYAQHVQDEENMKAEQRRLQREKEDDTARHYADTVFAAAREKRDTITFSLWDYGGQSVFYALHHLFLTKYGIYVLCVDLTEILTRPEVAKDYLSFWLNSVKLHAPTAPVLLVGTHIDELQGKILKHLKKANDFVVENFSKKFRQLTSLHPKYSFYPVDNKNNKGVDELRFDIERISRKQEFVTADVSIKWMFCLDKIMVNRDTGGKTDAWMPLSEVKKLAASVNITSHEEVERMLTMFHELGVLVRLKGTEELRNLITLDPQWLLDALCKVIRDERLHGPDEAELKKVGLVKEMKLLYEKGLASDDVMRYLWKDPAFKDHHNYLVDLMKYMVLISDWDFRDDKMYIIPSLLIPRPEDDDLFDADHIKKIEEMEKDPVKKNKLLNVKNIFRKKKKNKEDNKGDNKKENEEEEEITERTEETVTDYVIFDFSKVFLPMGVFQRLVCMCVSYSTSLGKDKKKKDKKVREPILYQRWAKIWMGNDTVLYLEQKVNTIWLSVEDPQTGPVCFKAVNSMLEKMNADLMGSGLQWDISMQKIKKTIYQKKGEKANVSDVVELDLKLSDARKQELQPWFKKKNDENIVVEAKKKEEMLDLENFVDSFA